MSYVDNLNAFYGGGGWDSQLAAIKALTDAGVKASDVLAVAQAYKNGTIGAGGGGGAATFTVRKKTADYTAVNGDIIEVDATAGPVTITMPITSGLVAIVKKVDNSANAVTIVTTAGGLDGGGSVVLSEQYQARMLVGTGTAVDVLGERRPFGSPSPLGGASFDGVSNYVARADHVHSTAGLALANHSHSVPVSTVNPMGAAKALDAGSADVSFFDCFLNVASCAITVTNWPTTGKYGEVVVRLHQDATGGRKVTWPTVIWAEGYPPVISGGANDVTEVVLYALDGGTTLFGSHGQPVRKHKFIVNGALSVFTGKLREYFEATARIVKLRISVGDTPVTTAAVVDVNLQGTTMYTTQANRPSVAAGSNTAVATLPDVVDIAAGQYLTLDVDVPSSAGYLVVDVITVEAQ